LTAIYALIVIITVIIIRIIITTSLVLIMYKRLIFFPRKITTMKLFVIAKYIADITSVTSLTIEQ